MSVKQPVFWIPWATVAALCGVGMWGITRALGTESRLTRCETRVDALHEDVKVIKADVREILKAVRR